MRGSWKKSVGMVSSGGNAPSGMFRLKPMIERLQEQPFLVERDAFGALDVGDEGGVRLDDVELAGAQAEHPHVGIGADLDADVEVGLLAPVFVIDLQLDVLAAVPGVELVGSGADHVGGHERVGLAGLRRRHWLRPPPG